MKRSFLLSIMLIAILSLGTMLVLANVDDEGNPNDPFTNDRANACFEGGSLEGKCNEDGNGDGVVTDAEIQIQWTCGWYLIRVEAGIYSRDEIPTFCNIFLPPLPVLEDDEVVEVVEPLIGCQGPIYSFMYADFGDGNYVPASATFYTDANCTSTYGPYTNGFAFAMTQGEANTICSANESGTAAGSEAGTNIYPCIFVGS